MAAIRAGVTYFAIAFVAGFALGTFRVLAIAPVVGELSAVALELPVMLTVAWLTCRRLTVRLGVPGAAAPRLLMGGIALLLLTLAELALALALGRSVRGYVDAIASPAGLLGLAGQAVFGLFPLLQARWRPKPS